MNRWDVHVASGARLAISVAVACLTLGCRAPFDALGASGPATIAKANDVFGALALRFGVADRDTRFAAIRPRLVRHALTPSRIYEDTALWTSVDSAVRTVSIEGTVVGNRYLLAARDSVGAPARPGDSRHLMHLRRHADDIHQWDSTDEVAIGGIHAAEVFDLLEGLLRGSERPAEQLRTEYHAHLPLTTASLSRLFVLDSLSTERSNDGSTEVRFTTRLDPDRLRPFAPRYADYIEEYLTPMRFDIALVDSRDSVVASVRYARNVLAGRYRSRDGRLVPLAIQVASDTTGIGAAAGDEPRPEYRLRISFSAEVLFLDIGTTRLVASVKQIDRPGERGWTMRFADEPRWHFPLAVNRLLRAPLRRPFEGEGAMLEYVVRDAAATQTVLARNIHIVVQESAIVRWLGALGATAMGDLSLAAEQEKDRFVGDVFRALGEDVRAMFAPRIGSSTPDAR